MHRVLRTALALVALSAAVYAIASLTGGWLGTPPWWEREVVRTLPIDWNDPDLFPEPVKSSSGFDPEFWAPFHVPRHGRELISTSIAAASLALFAWAAWPRRARPTLGGDDVDPQRGGVASRA